MRMLENEGFSYEGYLDIFDGGPTMTARTDKVRSIRDARTARVIAVDRDGGDDALVATGVLADFRCTMGQVRPVGTDGIVLSVPAAAALGVGEDDRVVHIGRT
jgi:arginine N-succinyltransferase